MKIWICLLLLLTACGQEPAPSIFSGTAMTIDYRILIGASLSLGERQEIESRIQQVFDEVNAHYNKFNPHSELSRLNDLKAHVAVPLSTKLNALLLKTDEIVSLTNGKFDPTIEPLQELWKANLKLGKEPSLEEIEALKSAVGWHNIHIEGGIFYKDRDLTRLDLGGIAKGYSVDLLIDELRAAGYPNIFVEWGGEIRAIGRHPENRPWRALIAGFESPDPLKAIACVDLNNQAIATSGDYMQVWKIGTKLYTHIFDPFTCRPLEITEYSIASSSVLASNCTFADGIAKVGMLFPTIEEAKKWGEGMRSHYPELQFWFSLRE